MIRFFSRAIAMLPLFAAMALPYQDAPMPDSNTPPVLGRVSQNADDPAIRELTRAIRNVEQRVTAAAAGNTTVGESLQAHEARHANVHGIPNTANLATLAQAASFANGARVNAIAAAAASAEDLYVPQAGGVIHGDLNIEGTLNVGSYPHEHPHTDITDWDSAVSDVVADAIADGNYLSEPSADSRYLQLTGGIMTGDTEFDAMVGIARPPVGGGWNFSGNMRALFLPILVDPAYSPRIGLGVYNSTDPSDWSEMLRIGVARAANEGVAGTAVGDVFLQLFGSGLLIDGLRIVAGTGIGVNATPGSETLVLEAASDSHKVLKVLPKQGGTAPSSDVVSFHKHTGAITLRQRETYDWELLRQNLVLGDVVENLAPGADHVIALTNGTAPTSSPIGGFAMRAESGYPHFDCPGDVTLDLTPMDPIADSTGLLLDLTTQFNTLLAELRASGLLAT